MIFYAVYLSHGAFVEEKPDIAKQLREAQEQREKLMKQLKESEDIIASIETRLGEVTKSQEARLRADDRFDNKLLDQVQNKKTTRSETLLNTDEKPLKKDSGRNQVLAGETSWYEITVDEDGNKKEELRKR
jgi:hypothetical protein